MIHLNAAHKIVLRRNHRNALTCDIKALFQTIGYDIREVVPQFRLWNRPKVLPHIRSPVFLHLLEDFSRQNIPRQQFVDKAVHVFVIELRALSPHRLRNEKTPVLRLRGVQGGGMDLHIVDVLQCNIVSARDGQCISCHMAKVGGVAV